MPRPRDCRRRWRTSPARFSSSQPVDRVGSVHRGSRLLENPSAACPLPKSGAAASAPPEPPPPRTRRRVRALDEVAASGPPGPPGPAPSVPRQPLVARLPADLEPLARSPRTSARSRSTSATKPTRSRMGDVLLQPTGHLPMPRKCHPCPQTDLLPMSPDCTQVGLTPRISCEAVPASVLAGAGMSRHLHPRNGAGESFVSFIRLFCGPAQDSL